MTASPPTYTAHIPPYVYACCTSRSFRASVLPNRLFACLFCSLTRVSYLVGRIGFMIHFVFSVYTCYIVRTSEPSPSSTRSCTRSFSTCFRFSPHQPHHLKRPTPPHQRCSAHL